MYLILLGVAFRNVNQIDLANGVTQISSVFIHG